MAKDFYSKKEGSFDTNAVRFLLWASPFSFIVIYLEEFDGPNSTLYHPDPDNADGRAI